jgi:hypothetical protein
MHVLIYIYIVHTVLYLSGFYFYYFSELASLLSCMLIIGLCVQLQ